MPRIRTVSFRSACIAGLAFIVGLVTACSTAPSSPAPAAWIEPEWFAEARTDRVYWQDWFNECMAEYGVQSREIIGSGFGSFFSDASTPADVAEAGHAAIQTCGNLLFQQDPQPMFLDEPIGEAAYLRMLDTRACVIYHGFDIPEPPPMENWIAMQGRWGAFGVINPSLTREEAIALNDACPQVGWGSFNWQDPTRFD